MSDNVEKTTETEATGTCPGGTCPGVNRECKASTEYQELLELVWKARESGDSTLTQKIDLRKHHIDVDASAETCIKMGLLKKGEQGLEFTPEGEKEALSLVRRHRLAEVLMFNVFSLPPEPGEQAACTFEHILTPEVTEHICIFLGHPKVCPDGKPIPAGICCEKQVSSVSPIIMPLTELQAGDIGRIIYIETAIHERLGRLASYGIMPGSKIKLHQRRPSFVVRSENTDIALDDDIARAIFVRRLSDSNGEGLR